LHEIGRVIASARTDDYELCRLGISSRQLRQMVRNETLHLNRAHAGHDYKAKQRTRGQGSGQPLLAVGRVTLALTCRPYCDR